MPKRQIRVEQEQRDRLHAMKNSGEDYGDVLDRILDVFDEHAAQED